MRITIAKIVLILSILVVNLIILYSAEAQYDLQDSVFGNGGSPAQGGGYYLNGTVGQPCIGVSGNASSMVLSGFWYKATPSEQGPVIGVTPASLVFGAVPGGPAPAPQKLYISNTGSDTLFWNVSDNANWLSLAPTSGSCTAEIDEVTVSVDISGLSEGVYYANITITAIDALNSPQVVQVTLSFSVFRYQMSPGWHLISFYTNKCFYYGTEPTDQPLCVEKVDVGGLGFSSLSNWFSYAINPGDSWQMVIGLNGAMDRLLPPIFHTLNKMSPISGYWVKIDEGSGGAVLTIEGASFNLDCGIPLQSGWNLVGFPSTVAYYDTDTVPAVNVPDGTTWVHVAPPVAAHVFQNIAGKYSMVMSDYGAYDPSLPPVFSSLHYIAPGYGYWLEMNQATELKYPR